MAATGQTINDRLNAVKYALAGQGLARTVCKATTEEVLGPKKKHIDYLIACAKEPNVSIPQLANLLIDRSQHTSWAVVFKSLITIHHLMRDGDERFTQYLATSNHSFELNDFMDRTTPQGYNMSTFVRRYAKYINEKISSYKTLAIDLCKINPGKDNALRTMNMEKLTKTLPVVHAQFDSLLEFNIEQKDLENNGVVLAAFKLLYKDLNRIFAAYQEAIINLVERYFKLSRKKTREALSMYKKYLDRLDKVATFFKVVEQIGIEKNEMPDTSKLTSLLAVLEDHLAQLEAKKRGNTPASPDNEHEPSDSPEPKEPSSSQQAEQATTSSSSSEHKEAKSQAPVATPPPPHPPPPPATAVVPSTSTSEPAAPKKPPPARPSPIVSPKASPSGPKKVAPPERPAKPPSRPPPPSAAAPPPAATTTETAASQSATPQAPPPPPPPPPQSRSPAPPESTSHQTAASASSAQEPEGQESHDTPQQTAEGNGQSSASAQDGRDSQIDESVAGVAAGGGDAPTTSSLPSCTAIASGGSETEARTEETNHVATTNNVNNNHIDVDEPNGDIQPPPPPPIDEQAPQGDEEPEQEANHNHRASSNNGAAGGDVDSDPPPPPPPPPIDEVGAMNIADE